VCVCVCVCVCVYVCVCLCVFVCFRTITCAGVVFAWHVEALDELDVEEAGRGPLARHLIETNRVGLVES
jgi:hypothetical protein